MSGPRVIEKHEWKSPYYPNSMRNSDTEAMKLCGVPGCGLPYEAQVHWSEAKEAELLTPKVEDEGLSTHEPMPVADPLRGNVQDLVIADIEERKRVGIERYGTPLQTFNGRDAVIDLYQELLDAVMYIRQFMEERKQGAAQAALLRLRTQVEAVYTNYVGQEGRGGATSTRDKVLAMIDKMLENAPA